MILNNQTAKKLKKDFPIFKNNPKLVYLDNAATSQKPKSVIKAMNDFYEKENANASRGIYTLAEEATKKLENSRKIIANFINAKPEEIIFTKNTTESINLLSYTLQSIISKEKNEIVLTEMEHHSNTVPWQEFAKRNKMKLIFIKMKEDFTLDLGDAKKKINKNTAIVSLCHVSNVLGTINPIEDIVNIAKRFDAITIVDAAQSVQHLKIDTKKINCDFLAFSSHKIYGPMGVGVLYGKKELMEKLHPFLFGGGMIRNVSFEISEFAEIPDKFEAGTQNIVGTFGLAEAVKYIEKIGMENIKNFDKKLLNYALEKLSKIEGIKIYNTNKKNRIAIISFNLRNIHPHDTASMLNDYEIAVRAGHHCAMPLMKKLGVNGTVRASFGIYNTFEDVDKLAKALNEISKKFK